MKTWIKRTLYVFFGVSIAIGGLSACGHRQDGRGWQSSAEDSAKFRGRIVERVADRLELNAEQKQRLTVLGDKLQQQRAALIGNTTNPRAEMQALVAGEKFDRARARAFISDKTAALSAGSPEVIAAAADFFDSLTPVQQQKMRDFMQRRGGWQRG